MKMKNRFLAVLLAASMSFSAAACGSAADAGKQEDGKPTTDNAADDGKETDAYAAALQKMKDISSLNGKMLMETNMSITMGGETQSVQTTSTTNMSCMYDPVRIKMDMTMDAGNDTTIDINAYAEQAEDGTYTMYMHNGSEWLSQTLEATDMTQYDAASNLSEYMKESYDFKDAGTEQIDGKNARKYSGVITGDDMRETLVSSGAMNSLNTLNIDESQIETIFKDLGEMPITLWIDETDFYPVKYEVDMASAANGLMSGILEAAGDEAGDMSIEVSTMKMEMTCSDFNAVEEFSIPDEAKEAAPAA